MSGFASLTRHLQPALFLDYGADAVDGETAACEICERGMRFRAPWRFDLGAMLNIAFALNDGDARRIEAEGYVVDCAKDETGTYQTTLAFLETPQQLRESLGKVSSRLECSAHKAGGTLAGNPAGHR